MVGPNYKAPAMPAAARLLRQRPQRSTGPPPSRPTRIDRGDWWAIYQSAELNDLERRCAKANQSIEAALHAYEQAHDLMRENRAALYPTVAVGAGASRDQVSANRPLRPRSRTRDYWDFLIPLNISWEPDLWGGVRRQIRVEFAPTPRRPRRSLPTRGSVCRDCWRLRISSFAASICRHSYCARRSMTSTRRCN